MWITNGVQADWICCWLIPATDRSHRNKSLICVPMKSKGVQVARKLDKMGMRSSDTAQIFFDEARAERNRIGEEGKGFTYQMVQFQEERLWGAAACLKAHETIIAETVEYTGKRKAFGKSILDNQIVHFQLAEMQTEVELLRRAGLPRRRGAGRGRGCHAARHHGKAEGGTFGPRTHRCLLAVLGWHGFHERDAGQPRLSRQPPDLDRGGADEVMLTVLCR